MEKAQKEYYLTDIFKLLKKKNLDIDLLELKSSESYQIRGVNTIEQLGELNSIINQQNLSNI